MSREIFQDNEFKSKYKKMHANQKKLVNNAIKTIAQNPEIGEKKSGDLASTYVYKFPVLNLQMLLAYEFDATELYLKGIGVHENFYKKLKK